MNVLCIGGPWHGYRLPMDDDVRVPNGYTIEPCIALHEWVLVHGLVEPVDNEPLATDDPLERDQASGSDIPH